MSKAEFRVLLLDLVHTVWKEKSVPQERANFVLVPVPKKGDLSCCNNWRGISLLDVVGEVVAHILQDQLQQLAKEELPESQCSFQKERGCSDMIFVCQLIEKSWGHQAKLFLLFIDLRKAYDSVPQGAMWLALGKLRVPDSIIELIRFFRPSCDSMEPLWVKSTAQMASSMDAVWPRYCSVGMQACS